jgi:hypothetical protein
LAVIARLFPLLALLCGGACLCGELDGGGTGSTASCGGLGDGFGGMVVGESPGAGDLKCLLLNPVRGDNNRLAIDHNAGISPLTEGFAAGSRVSLFVETVDADAVLSFASDDESVVQVAGQRQILFVGAGATRLRLVDEDLFEVEAYPLQSVIPDEVMLNTLNGTRIGSNGLVEAADHAVLLVELLQESVRLNHNAALQVEILERAGEVTGMLIRAENFCQGIDSETLAGSPSCPPCDTRLLLEGSGDGMAKVRVWAIANPDAQAIFRVRYGEGGDLTQAEEGGPDGGSNDGGTSDGGTSDGGTFSSDGGSLLGVDSGNP